MPAVLEVEFKKPTLLPNKLTLAPAPGSQAGVAAAAAAGGGFTWSVADKKGAAILLGSLKCGAAAKAS